MRPNCIYYICVFRYTLALVQQIVFQNFPSHPADDILYNDREIRATTFLLRYEILYAFAYVNLIGQNITAHTYTCATPIYTYS